MDNIMSSKVFRTRQGTILLGVVAAVLAAIALIVYLNQYTSNANKSAQVAPVLVAQGAIAKNTTGEVIASSHLVKPVQISQSKIENGAITNTNQIAGQVAVTDIAAGEQLTTSDFAAPNSATVGIPGQLTRGQRAVVVPLELPAQVGNQISPGDQVDVYALVTVGSTPVVREILQNMYVINTNSNGNVTLRATPDQAGKLIYAAGNDKIWLTLRPPHGSVTKPTTITPTSLLRG